METITIGQISLAITFMVGLISGVGALTGSMKKWINKALEDQFDHTNKRIDSLQLRIDEVDAAACKNFLVARLAEVENGREMSETTKERFYEQYEHYIKIGGNSYIRKKVEQLEADGKL